MHKIRKMKNVAMAMENSKLMSDIKDGSNPGQSPTSKEGKSKGAGVA